MLSTFKLISTQSDHFRSIISIRNRTHVSDNTNLTTPKTHIANGLTKLTRLNIIRWPAVDLPFVLAFGTQRCERIRRVEHDGTCLGRLGDNLGSKTKVKAIEVARTRDDISHEAIEALTYM